jgi:hypothetical protein
LQASNKSPRKQQRYQGPTINQAWTWYAAGIKDRSPNREDFANFVRDYQALYVDPHLTSLRLKPQELKVAQKEFQLRAQQYGDSLGLKGSNGSMVRPSDIQAEIRQRKKNSEDALTSWVGANIDNFMMMMGAPDSEYKMPDGNVIYTWQSTRGMPAVGGGEITISCKISIFVNPYGRIFNYKWEGNGC